jgi:hypothetical protein
MLILGNEVVLQQPTVGRRGACYGQWGYIAAAYWLVATMPIMGNKELAIGNI